MTGCETDDVEIVGGADETVSVDCKDTEQPTFRREDTAGTRGNFRSHDQPCQQQQSIRNASIALKPQSASMNDVLPIDLDT